MNKTPFYMRVTRSVGKHGELVARRRVAKAVRPFAEAGGRNIAASAGGGQYAVRAVTCWNLQQRVSASVCEAMTGESKAGLIGMQHAQGGVRVRRAVRASRAL
jgi:hypothetical protein